MVEQEELVELHQVRSSFFFSMKFNVLFLRILTSSMFSTFITSLLYLLKTTQGVRSCWSSRNWSRTSCEQLLSYDALQVTRISIFSLSSRWRSPVSFTMLGGSTYEFTPHNAGEEERVPPLYCCRGVKSSCSSNQKVYMVNLSRSEEFIFIWWTSPPKCCCGRRVPLI